MVGGEPALFRRLCGGQGAGAAARGPVVEIDFFQIAVGMLDFDERFVIVDGHDFEQLAVAAVPVADDGFDALRVAHATTSGIHKVLRSTLTAILRPYSRA